MAYLFILTQEDNNGYDTYDSCIVCAEDESEAKNILPISDSDSKYVWGETWANSPDTVQAECIGIADSNIVVGKVVLASFNAG